MIDQADFLVAIADLSIALIAFTTIVVALRQMTGGRLEDFQILVVKLFSVCGFSALFFALLPLLLSFFSVPESTLWKICNVLLGLNAVSIHIWYFRSRRRVAPGRRLNLTNYINIATLLIAVVLLALGVSGVAFDGSIAPYAFALTALLVAAATAFLRTLRDFLSPPA